MPRSVSPLSHKQIKAAKPIAGRVVRLRDGNGLQLLVKPSGRKVFELRTQRNGRDTTVLLGEYGDAHPFVSLSRARELAEEERVRQRQAARGGHELPKVRFEDAMEDWYKVRQPLWTPKYAADSYSRLRLHAAPRFGKRLVAEIAQREMREFIYGIETGDSATKNAAPDQARKVRVLLHDLFNHCIQRGWLDDNPANLPMALRKGKGKARKARHHPAPRLQDMAEIVRSVRGLSNVSTRGALLLVIFSACRSGEVRNATWDEFDFKKALWTVPASRMKTGEKHEVPLSRQALEVLNAMPRIAGEARVFPGARGGRALSDNTLTYALQGLGFKDEHGEKVTTHGLRSTFKDWCRLNDVPEFISEIALAHKQDDKVIAAYGRDKMVEKRTEIMQAWADVVSPTTKKGGRNKK